MALDVGGQLIGRFHHDRVRRPRNETAIVRADGPQLFAVPCVFPQQSIASIKFKKLCDRCWRTRGHWLCFVGGIRVVTQKLVLPDGCGLCVSITLMRQRQVRLLTTVDPSRPCLLSSLLGLVNIAITLSIHHGTESLLNSSSLAALVLSITSSTSYLTLTLLTFRKIHIVRERDGMHRHRSDSESYHLLPEDEMQRQQLLRLLQRENNNKNQKPSSANASQSTFRIDLPDSPRRMETSLMAPRTVHESGRNDTHN
ncbi:MAG: hypothetical protein L6R35_006830, partial [Caloplaca aegaea]